MSQVRLDLWGGRYRRNNRGCGARDEPGELEQTLVMLISYPGLKSVFTFYHLEQDLKKNSGTK